MKHAGPIALTGILLFASPASAVVPNAPAGAKQRIVAETLTAMPAAKIAKPLRTQRGIKFSLMGSSAFARFQTSAGPAWRAAWDPATGVPSRLWGPGIQATGAMLSPTIAEKVAREVLAEHLALLAPGARLEDFILVSNTSDGDIRSIGFVQQLGARRVVGGQVSFRFKNDRLFLIGSEALPNVVVTGIAARAALSPEVMRARAADNLRRDLDLPAAPVTVKGDDVILPLVGESAVLGYRIATPMMIDGGSDGRYLAYVDPSTGEALAVHQQNLYATATVKYRSVDRNPARPRVDKIAPNTFVQVAGVGSTTSSQGIISWSPDTAQTLATSVSGAFATVVNKAPNGVLASTQMQIAPGGSITWDASLVPEDDAQIVTYLAVNAAKDFVRTHLDPQMKDLDAPLVANVNLQQNCNAFFDGKALNFFHASMMCQNTGLIEDVVFHEFGHAVHTAEIIDGVGSFDGAMSEGAADFLAAQMTDDSGMGRGFFFTEEPLRQLDPPDKEFSWPADIGEIHHTGLIFGGTFWDLRKALIAQFGAVKAQVIVGKIYVGALRRSVSIPTSMFEALATDDDDGDLTNGTPHECAIRDAYARHGLRTASGVVDAPGVLDKNALNIVIRVDLNGLAERCGGDAIDNVELAWMPSYTGMPAAGTAQMQAVNPSRYFANLPLALEGDVFYSARVHFKDGSSLVLADNLGDPYYTIFQGHTVPLYCTDFEDRNPFDEGWTTGTLDGSGSQWEWGSPTATGGGTDPPVAYSGTKVLGQKINGDYTPMGYSYIQLPDIDVGQWSDVRVQFRRWLAVEDSHFDKAKILANEKQVFINTTQGNGNSSSLHSIDKEWRFQDVQVSRYANSHTMKIKFDLASDEGLNLGGWTLDDVCVVAVTSSVCGDGIKSPTEECDDGPGNADVPGACRTWCHVPTCGDGIVDGGEQCDGGSSGTSSCTPTCMDIEDTSGCCSADGGPGGSLALGALVGLFVFRRRRTR